MNLSSLGFWLGSLDFWGKRRVTLDGKISLLVIACGKPYFLDGISVEDGTVHLLISWAHYFKIISYFYNAYMLYYYNTNVHRPAIFINIECALNLMI